ncbi:MAG: c-type cytochrome [Gammaproteobacteria bacterium]|nr:c-type cytochrome [Gammaproteobacteria bacterium]
MKQNKLHFGAAILGLAAVLSLPVAASASDLTDKCDKCHGKNGVSEDDKVPSIAGFSKVTIEDTMLQYKSGDRPADDYKPKDGESDNMHEISEKLSEDDIKSVAAHYSKQKFVPREQSFDAALAKAGAKVHDKQCEKCHSDNGANAKDDAAILAGQWRGYLKRQFELIASGEREVPKKMAKKFEKLKDGDVEKLIEFYVGAQ